MDPFLLRNCRGDFKDLHIKDVYQNEAYESQYMYGPDKKIHSFENLLRIFWGNPTAQTLYSVEEL